MTIEDIGDRRVRRTRHRLHTALMSLIMEIDYDKITVQNIIDSADVGRSTFYAHYETKDDLLLSGLGFLTNDIEQQIAEDSSADEMVLPALRIFQHVAENHRMFRSLLGSRGIDLVTRAALRVLTDQATAAIKRRAAAGEQSDIPQEVRAACVAGSLMALIEWWLDSGRPYTPEVMGDLYRQMMASA